MGLLSDTLTFFIIGFIGICCLVAWVGGRQPTENTQEISDSEYAYLESIKMSDEVVSEPVQVTEEQNDQITYRSICYIGEDGHTITIEENPNACDPTYEQLMEFLNSDPTNQREYENGYFTCGDFAETLQHNAESQGINAGWVSVDFEGETIGHACNAFNTTDCGLVFIDCTSAGDVHSDKIVSIEVGKEYIPQSRTSTNVEYPSMGVVSDFDIFW